MAKILILGGTREAAMLAAEKIAQGHDVTTSLAGRTREPLPLAGALRTGGFGGADGLALWLREQKIEQLIDATHPFATQISANAEQAARAARIPLERNIRPVWAEADGDRWTHAATIEEAAHAIPKNARVLLALGAQHIAPFAARLDVHFVIRMVDAPDHALPFARHTLLLGRPSIEAAEEKQMLQDHGIDQIICRNSGGLGAYAKIEAARELGLPVLMIARPI